MPSPFHDITATVQAAGKWIRSAAAITLAVGARAASRATWVTVEPLDCVDGDVVKADLAVDEPVLERYRDATTGVRRGTSAFWPHGRARHETYRHF